MGIQLCGHSWIGTGALIPRQRRVPDTWEESPILEADGVGTLHDQRDDKFYQGGIKLLTGDEAPPKQAVYDPCPDYNNEKWRKSCKGDFSACTGPCGTVLGRTKLEHMMSVYRGNQRGFPFPVFGPYEGPGPRCERLPRPLCALERIRISGGRRPFNVSEVGASELGTRRTGASCKRSARRRMRTVT